MSKLADRYDFNIVENKLQKFWLEKNTHSWQPNYDNNSYIIDTPPPTVSGQLHIGHVYSYTHTDFIARYHRMNGKNVFYPMGFDDNGLPTERLVEKKKKIKANQLSREEFKKICHEVIDEEEEKFKALFDKIALSVDWNLKYKTISDRSVAISQLSFLDLVSKNQIYRDSQPMLWDPIDQTALSQADIEEKERETFMNEIKFKIHNEEEFVIIGTTRPELLAACMCVFYHPDDGRYKKLKDKQAETPLYGKIVPFIEDELVDPEKGTGLVMCCTFGDQTDVIWWRKHKLDTKIIFTKYGTIDDVDFNDSMDIQLANSFHNQLKGLKIAAARDKIIEILHNENFLLSQTKKTQQVKCAERSGAPLEILTTPQWFVKSVEHKEALLKKSDELNWYPISMKIKLDSWIKNISLDWCISRQRYFGVAFPVWYSKKEGEEGKIIFAEADQLPVDPMIDLPNGYSRSEVDADMDVMDTWSTSSVSPQLNSWGISKDFTLDMNRHQQLFPADLRPQAHEILRTWAYYTMLKSYLHENKLPWKNIMVSGWCLAEDRSKMSKSKGNIVDPERLLSQYGSDVTRYWAASARLGADTAYSEDIMKNGKRLVNKLWNAAKFINQHFDKIEGELIKIDENYLLSQVTEDFDRYLLVKLSELCQKVTQEFEKYEYASVLGSIEEFFYFIYCDNYLEITKTRAYDQENINPKGANSARVTLFFSYQIILKLFAPLMPHITEEIYLSIYSDSSIHSKDNWPKLGVKFDELNIDDCEKLLSILENVRKLKAKDNISIKAPIAKLIVKGGALSGSLLMDLKDVTSSANIIFDEKFELDYQIEY